MSMILGKYKIIRKLGRGGFGQVYLVTDEENNSWAIKQMSKKKIAQDELSYIYNEIQIMKSLNSEYIVKLHTSHDTDNYIYIVLEFCNGGDLKKDMGKQPDKVYSLKEAAMILSDVIRGLEVVHTNGYLHRDIKIDNILVNTDKNNRKTYKIADFGLSKSSDRGETVLGTGSYMSPQIYQQQAYGFQVDMWAFGVVMYFMMNKEYPFKLSPHMNDSLQLQYEELIKQAKGFSYSKMVNNSKNKYLENCSAEVQDLFSKMFDIDPNRRITFSEIRAHPVFRQYFPDQINQQSKILYAKKLKIKETATKNVVPVTVKTTQNQNVDLRQSLALQISATEKFPKQKQFIYHKNNQIEFLYHNFKQFNDVHGVLTVVQKMPLCYNLLKYYIVLKRGFIEYLSSSQICKEYKQKQQLMRAFLKTESFKKQLKQFQEQLDGALMEFEAFHQSCKMSLEVIDKINSKFKETFNDKIFQTELDPFKASYRKSTLYVFNKLKKFLKEGNTGNKYNYFLALAVISHVFNRMFHEKQNLTKVFKAYLQYEKVTVDNIDYDKLRQWMSKATPEQLNSVTKNIITKYFQS